MNRTGWALLGVAASGIPAAVVWCSLGEPARWLVTERGLVLTEGNATGGFQVVAVFTVVGLLLGLVAGVVVHRITRPAHWRTIVGLATATLAAALVCWRLGVWLGPGPIREATGLDVGDTVPAPFAVDTIVPFLVWPLAAVLTYTISLYLSSDGVDERDDRYEDDEVSERSER